MNEKQETEKEPENELRKKKFEEEDKKLQLTNQYLKDKDAGEVE